jgi:hypothetical protein
MSFAAGDTSCGRQVGNAAGAQGPSTQQTLDTKESSSSARIVLEHRPGHSTPRPGDTAIGECRIAISQYMIIVI